MSNVQFAYTIVYVPAVEATIGFYERAFGLKRRFVSEDGDYGELETAGVTLSFASESLASSNLPAGFQPHRPGQLPFGSEIGFTTSDVQQIVNQAIDSGATLVSEPREKPWGQTVAYIRDPNGVLIEICTPISG